MVAATLPPVAVVTGAARGIGAATAEALATQGWDLALVDLGDPETDSALTALGYRLSTEVDLIATAARIGAASGSTVLACPADVRSADGLVTVCEQVIDRFGRLDAAIGAAGIMAGGADGWCSDPEIDDLLIDINLKGVMNLARAAVPGLLNRPEPRSGRFIAVSSAAAGRGPWRLGAYAAAKAGVEGFVRCLAAELLDSGVTANAVSPGSTDTAMLARTAELYGLASGAGFAPHHSQKRILQPAEVAAVIAFLAGPDSSAITGRVIETDGGFGL